MMIGLVSINLLLLIFDTLYSVELVNDLLKDFIPTFHQAYHPIHKNFLLIDLVFVSIFLFEFAVRWVISIVQKEYLRWYFFPFSHWYDLLGCIPIGPYRALRFLRIISICYRLQKHQIVDFSNWAVFRFFKFYYSVFVEEVSDRVVINVLDGAKKEVELGSPFYAEVVDDILMPRKQLVIDWLSTHIADKASHILVNKRSDIEHYINSVVTSAVNNNDEIERVKLTPVVGPLIANTLNDTISDIVYRSIENILKDLSSPANKGMVEELANLFLTGTPHNTLSDEDIRSLLIDIIEATKSQVSVQHWKTNLV